MLNFVLDVQQLSAGVARLRRVLAEATLIQVVKDQREQLMARVREQLDSEARAFGSPWSMCAFVAPTCRAAQIASLR